MGKITERTPKRVAAWSGYPEERILGMAEVAVRFGVTRQRAGQIARTDKTFPGPGFNDGSGRAWLAAGVECWAAAHRPTADTGRFGPEAAALLRHAESVARPVGHAYVSSVHIWHALASDVGGTPLAEAIRSMGLDPSTIEEWFRRIDPGLGASRARRMTPATQERLEAADTAAWTAGRARVLPTDVALAFVDSRRHLRESLDYLIAYGERRGLDSAELRRRISVVAADPEARADFPFTPLPKRRPARRTAKRPAWLDLAPNPLGHDPWVRRPWGAAFAVTREGRHLTLDDKHWFFYTDGDGFFVRAADGRPVGYRYRVLHKVPKRLPGRPKMEILPMPPFPLRDWPDHRYVREG